MVIPSAVLFSLNQLPGSPFDFNVSAGYAVGAIPGDQPAVNGTSPSPSPSPVVAPKTYTPIGSIAFGQGLVSGTAGDTLAFYIVSR